MLVIATALIVAAVLTAVVIGFGRILLNVRNRAEQVVGQLTAVPRKTMSFAYSITSIRSVVTIRNMEGDAVVRRELKGVRPRESMSMSRLHGRMSGSGEVAVPPALTLISGAPDPVEFKYALTGPGASSYEVDFKRPLSHGEAVDLTIQAEFSHHHRMTRAAIDEAYRNDEFRHEYTALTVDVPVDVLVLEIVFPSGFEANAYGIVFYGDSETVADAESRVVREAVKPLEGVKPLDSSLPVGKSEADLPAFRLTVTNPQLRFQYGIYWIPAR